MLASGARKLNGEMIFIYKRFIYFLHIFYLYYLSINKNNSSFAPMISFRFVVVRSLRKNIVFYLLVLLSQPLATLIL